MSASIARPSALRSFARFGRARLVPVVLACLGSLGCEDLGKKSAALAEPHATFLAEAATSDVGEVARGLPLGTAHLEAVLRAAHPEAPAPESARDALTLARDRIQDLRVAKSTFFALSMPDGRIVRSSQEQDELADKNVFTGLPGLKPALEGKYVETRGILEGAAGVRGRPDGQWAAAAPVKIEGEVRALYVTGWSWSAYAYRLETGLRSKILGDTEEGDKVPLVYVYVVVGDSVYGAPVSPVVSADAISKQAPLTKAKGDAVWTTPIEIDGRSFGLAVKRVPALGADVAVAVLRSET